jgi:hypothetical protein
MLLLVFSIVYQFVAYALLNLGLFVHNIIKR